VPAASDAEHATYVGAELLVARRRAADELLVIGALTRRAHWP